jgi:hypothetical protein
MRRISLSFVHSDRIRAREFDQACLAAGFHGSQALQFGPRVYAGPSRSERRVAAAVAQRLWLPVTIEPALISTALGVGDEPPRLDGIASRYAAAYPAGAGALELALRHGSTHAALVAKHSTFEQIAAELTAMISDHVVRAPERHAATSELELLWLDSLKAAGQVEIIGSEPVTGAMEASICAFLRRQGADRIAHPGGILLDHLRRTAQRLEHWQARPELVAAGLCHAVYGTHGFPQALLNSHQRLELAQLIGSETEAIVYAYGCCDRSAGYPSLEQPSIRDRFTGQCVPLHRSLIRDLTELTCANELDVLRYAASAADEIAGYLADLLVPRRSLLSPAAWASCEEALDTIGVLPDKTSPSAVAP